MSTADDLEDRLADLYVIREDVAGMMVRAMEMILEDTPFEEWIRKAVAEHVLDPEIVDDFFGEGEGAGSPRTGGYTLRNLVDSWFTIQRQVEETLLEIKRMEQGGESIHQQ